MARSYTASELVDILRDKANLGDIETEGTLDTDLLKIINDEALTRIYAAVMHCREDYFLVREKIALTTTKTKYRINHRAMQQKIRDIIYWDSTNVRCILEQIPRENRSGYSETSSTTVPSAYFFEGNHIVLVPDVGAQYTGYLEISFYFRPGELVDSSECRQITNVTTGVITLDSSVPSAWTTAKSYDIHSEYSGAEIKTWSITPTLVAGTQMTFTSTDVDGSAFGRLPAEVGDWVCLEEEAALPGLPREWHPILAQAAVVSVLERLDVEKYNALKEDLDASIKRMYDSIIQRDESFAHTVPIMNSAHIVGRSRGLKYG